MPPMMPAMLDPTPVTSGHARWPARLAWWSTLGLIALGLAWELALAPTGRGTLAIKVVPLLFAVPGLWQHRLYTYRWLSLLVWLYFTEGVVRAWSERGLGAQLAGLEVALALALFVACLAQVRVGLRTRA